MTLIEQLEQLQQQYFHGYPEALARRYRAQAACDAAKNEFASAHQAVIAYGGGPDSLRWAISEIRDLLSKEPV